MSFAIRKRFAIAFVGISACTSHCTSRERDVFGVIVLCGNATRVAIGRTRQAQFIFGTVPIEPGGSHRNEALAALVFPLDVRGQLRLQTREVERLLFRGDRFASRSASIPASNL